MKSGNKTETIVNWIWRSCIVLSLVLFIAIKMTGTFAGSTGGDSDHDIADGKYKIHFTLYEKILDNNGNWVETTNPIQGAKFRLYKEGAGGTRTLVKMYEGFTDDGTGSTVTSNVDEYTTNENGDIGAPASIDDGSIRIRSLGTGTYYLVEENKAGNSGLTYGYKYDENAGAEIKEYKIEVDAAHVEDPDAAEASQLNMVRVKAYNRRGYADLKVKKTIKNASGSAVSTDQKKQEFNFVGIFGDKADYQYIVTDADGNDKGAQTLDADAPMFKLKHGETATIKNVPIGTHYSVSEVPVSGYSISLEGSNAGNIEYPSADNHQNVINFINTYDGVVSQDGGLTITKQLYDKDGESADTATEFTFVVTFENSPEGAKYHYTINGTDQIELPADGKIKLKSGQTAVFTDIPAGVKYKVVEENPGGDYIQGTDTTSGTIGSEKIAKTYYNNYKTDPDDPAKGSLTVEKKIVGTVDADKEFTFKVDFTNAADPDMVYHYRINGGEEKTLADGKIVLKSGQKAVFTDIPVGVTYTVTEEADTDYIAGVGSVKGTIAPNDTAAARFFNQKNEAKEGPGKLIVKKIVKGDGADLTKKFKFTITIGGTKHEVMLANGEESEEFNLPVGVVYQVEEDDYYPDGYRQSTVVHGFGTGTGKTVRVEQTNTYFGDVTPDIPDGGSAQINTPTVQKKISAKEKISKPSDFKFVLEGKDNAPMPKNTNGLKKKVTISGEGTADFGSISYKKAGIYRYTIWEENTKATGYSYDKSVYEYIVTVTEKDGKLTAKAAFKKVNDAKYKGKTAVFTNKYSLKNVPVVDGSGNGSGPGGTGTMRAPKTSDTMSPMLWFVLMLLSACLARSFMFRCLSEKKTIE